MYKTRTILKAGFIFAACLALVSCGGNKIKPPEPAKLQRIETRVVFNQLWEHDSAQPLEDNLSSLQPEYVAGRAYVTTLGGRMSALDLATGNLIWQVDINDNVSAATGASEDVVVVVTEDGKVVARSAHNGALIWEHPVDRAIVGTPLVYRQGVYVRSIDGVVVGIDLKSGSELWKTVYDQPNFMLRDSVKLFGYGENVVIGNAGGQIAAYDADVGILNWDISSGVPRQGNVERLDNVNSNLLIAGNTLYATALPDKLISYDLRNLGRLWSRSGEISNRLTASSLQVFGVGDDNELFAIDRVEGIDMWNQRALLHRGVADMAVVGDYLVVADNLGVMHALLAATGEFAGRLSDKKRVIAGGLHAQSGTLYVSYRSGELRAYSLVLAR